MPATRSNIGSIAALVFSVVALFVQSETRASSASSSGASAFTAEAAPAGNIFNYQGILRKPDGSLVTGSYTMTFSLYNVVAGGDQLHTETQPNVSVRDGIFNVLIGDVKAIPDVVLTPTVLFLGIAIGNESEMTPRQRIHAVPRALKADSIAGGQYWTKADGSLDVDGSLIVRGNYMHGGNGTIALSSQNGSKQPVYLQNIGGTFYSFTDGKLFWSGNASTFTVYPSTLNIDSNNVTIKGSETVNQNLTVGGSGTVNGNLTVNGRIRGRIEITAEKSVGANTTVELADATSAVCFLTAIHVGGESNDQKASVYIADGKWYLRTEYYMVGAAAKCIGL